MLKAMSKFQGVLKMFILGLLKTILKIMLKYEKNTITLYSTCWNWAADFVFLLRFYTRKRSETYMFADWKWLTTSSKSFTQSFSILDGSHFCYLLHWLTATIINKSQQDRTTDESEKSIVRRWKSMQAGKSNLTLVQ